MTDRFDAEGIPEAAVAPPRRLGISLIWLVPVFAVGLGAVLAWQYYANLGPVITITFDSAEGVAPDATKVRYKDVDIGDVIDVALDPMTDEVVVSARIDHTAGHLLGSETRFWIVKPRAGISGISGIGTILTGTYINTDPGGGPRATRFEGLEDPPLTPLSNPGLRIKLKSTDAQSVRVGSPVYYRQIKVGQVDGRTFTDNFSAVEFVVFVLMELFNKTRTEATQIMLHVHTRGQGVCGIYPHDIAETKVNQTVELAREHGHPLMCSMEPE